MYLLSCFHNQFVFGVLSPVRPRLTWLREEEEEEEEDDLEFSASSPPAGRDETDATYGAAKDKDDDCNGDKEDDDVEEARETPLAVAAFASRTLTPNLITVFVLSSSVSELVERREAEGEEEPRVSCILLPPTSSSNWAISTSSIETTKAAISRTTREFGPTVVTHSQNESKS